MPHGIKTFNEYAREFGRLYERTPKAVFAAVAFSLATWATGNELTPELAIDLFCKEWQILNDNQIVSQKALSASER